MLILTSKNGGMVDQIYQEWTTPHLFNNQRTVMLQADLNHHDFSLLPLVNQWKPLLSHHVGSDPPGRDQLLLLRCHVISSCMGESRVLEQWEWVLGRQFHSLLLIIKCKINITCGEKVKEHRQHWSVTPHSRDLKFRTHQQIFMVLFLRYCHLCLYIKADVIDKAQQQNKTKC